MNTNFSILESVNIKRRTNFLTYNIEQNYTSSYQKLVLLFCTRNINCKNIIKVKKSVLKSIQVSKKATFSNQVRENNIAKFVVVFNKKNETIIRFPQVQEEFREASKFITN